MKGAVKGSDSQSRYIFIDDTRDFVSEVDIIMMLFLLWPAANIVVATPA
jgi:hypothetical protein